MSYYDTDDGITINDQVEAMTPRQRESRRVELVDTIARLRNFDRLTAAQDAALEAAEEEFMAVMAQQTQDEITRASTMAALERNGRDGRFTEGTDQDAPGGRSGPYSRRRGGDPTVIARTARIAYDGLERIERFTPLNSDEMLHRADGALNVLRAQGVPDEGIDRLGSLLEAIEDEPIGQSQARRSGAAELVMAGSDPTYASAFRKFLRNPEFWRNEMTSEEFASVQRTRNAHSQIIGRDWQTGETLDVREWENGEYVSRTALSLTGANGGFLVPLTLDPSIMIQNVSSANPYRRLARIVQTSTNTWQGVNSVAGMNAQWLAEGTAAADATPVFAQTIITPLKAAAWSFGSVEVLMDSDYATQLPNLLADARDRLEETAFATGAGTTVPFGSVTRATALATGGGTITVANVTALHQALPARFRVKAKAAWVGNIAAIDLLRVLPLYTNGPPVVVGNELPVFGEPIYESTSMDGTIAVGGHKVLMYLDGNQYIIADRVGMSVTHINNAIMSAAGNLPMYQSGFAAFWRTGADSAVQGTSTGIRVLSLT